MLDRRTILAGGGVALGLALSGRADADDRSAKPGDARTALLEALAGCVGKASACDNHCATQLASGAKEFARCAAAVGDILALGDGVRRLVSRRSVSAKRVVEAFAALCKECSAACLEHKAHWAHGMHLECKECQEACEACAAACSTFVTT